MANETERRKIDHIRICLEKNVEAKNLTSGFENVFFVHRAVPRVDYESIDLSVDFLGHKFSAPIIVEALTGGAEKATEINRVIALAVEELGLGMGVGSQRAAIEDESLEYTFKVVRENAPNAFIIANLGYSQIASEYSVKEVKRAVEMIEANAIAIHLNTLQEVIQTEGKPGGKSLCDKIIDIADAIDVPLIIKETGCGIAAEEAELLESLGVDCIDVAGAGGTSWAAVEYYRALEAGDETKKHLGEAFWDWGIPTAVSIVEVSQTTKLKVIASGGIRSGLHIAKSIALGADMTGIALPILKAAVLGLEEVKRKLKTFMECLKTCMFLVGVSKIEELKNTPVILTGLVAEWLKARGFNIEEYARRAP